MYNFSGSLTAIPNEMAIPEPEVGVHREIRADGGFRFRFHRRPKLETMEMSISKGVKITLQFSLSRTIASVIMHATNEAYFPQNIPNKISLQAEKFHSASWLWRFTSCLGSLLWFQNQTGYGKWRAYWKMPLTLEPQRFSE